MYSYSSGKLFIMKSSDAGDQSFSFMDGWDLGVTGFLSCSLLRSPFARMHWIFGGLAIQQSVRRNYELASQVKLLDGFLYQMGIDRVALIGHGLGAVVAVQYAFEYPDIVDRVMAVSCPMNETVSVPGCAPLPLLIWPNGLLAKSALTEPVRADAPKTDPRAISSSWLGLNDLR